MMLLLLQLIYFESLKLVHILVHIYIKNPYKIYSLISVLYIYICLHLQIIIIQLRPYNHVLPTVIRLNDDRAVVGWMYQG